MLVDFKTILAMAEKGNFAIPAFNVYNMETVMGVIAAAEEEKAPVILQVYSRLFHNEEGYFLAPIVLAAAQQAKVPVCFHIDHGAGEYEVTRALRYGVSGAMIDASALPFEENAALTKRVVETAAAVGIQVEGELGHIGSVNDDAMGVFTDPQEAAEYVAQTGVAALAVLVGNAHGRYKNKPNLDIERVAAISKATNGLPLVLHGGTGIPDEQIVAAIKAGIRKINFGTDVCFAFLDAVFATSREVYAVDLFMKNAIASVKAYAVSKIRLLGAAGQA